MFRCHILTSLLVSPSEKFFAAVVILPAVDVSPHQSLADSSYHSLPEDSLLKHTNYTMAPPQAQDIAIRGSAPNSSHHELSVSPSATFHSPSSFPHSFGTTTSAHQAGTKQLKPFETTDIKILLLENVNQSGQDILKSQGYQVEALKTSLPEEQLIEKIR